MSEKLFQSMKQTDESKLLPYISQMAELNYIAFLLSGLSTSTSGSTTSSIWATSGPLTATTWQTRLGLSITQSLASATVLPAV